MNKQFNVISRRRQTTVYNSYLNILFINMNMVIIELSNRLFIMHCGWLRCHCDTCLLQELHSFGSPITLPKCDPFDLLALNQLLMYSGFFLQGLVLFFMLCQLEYNLPLEKLTCTLSSKTKRDLLLMETIYDVSKTRKENKSKYHSRFDLTVQKFDNISF